MLRWISTAAGCLWVVVAMGCAAGPTSVTTDPGGAFITVNNVGVGTAPINYTFDFSKQPAYEVKASKTGYFDASATLNSEMVGVTNGVLNLALQEDESYGVTTTTDATNRWLKIEIAPNITQAEAWQKIVDAVTERYAVIEQMDSSSGYLRSVPTSRTFKHPVYGTRTIRTQFVGDIASSNPLVYKMQISSQISTPDGGWTPFDRVFKEDAQMVEELQSRLGTK